MLLKDAWAMNKEVNALEGMMKWKECQRMVIVGVVEQAK